MKPGRSVIVALGLVFAAHPSSATAQEPFDLVTGIVSWFTSLNKAWDGVVVQQERAQLLRSIDRLRRSLYTLEADSRLLLSDIPDGPPDADQAAALAASVSTLRASLADLNSIARTVGADLRLYGGAEAERSRTRAGAARGLALSELDRQLDDPRRWNAPFVRTRIRAAITELEQAQLAVTAFRQRLAAAR